MASYNDGYSYPGDIEIGGWQTRATFRQSMSRAQRDEAEIEMFKAQKAMFAAQTSSALAETEMFKAQTEYFKKQSELLALQIQHESALSSKYGQFLQYDAEERRLQVKLMQVDAREITLPPLPDEGD